LTPRHCRDVNGHRCRIGVVSPSSPVSVAEAVKRAHVLLARPAAEWGSGHSGSHSMLVESHTKLGTWRSHSRCTPCLGMEAGMRRRRSYSGQGADPCLSCTTLPVTP
ncbi:hypothetical protein PIB30_111159, partial [Stylosanthes scabra]|nr:hypothetical protein [Stylosanthes scabra]